MLYLAKSIESNAEVVEWAKEESEWTRFPSNPQFKEIVGMKLTPESVQEFFDQAYQNSDENTYFTDIVSNLGTDMETSELSSNVKQAYGFYKENVENADFGWVRAYQILIDNTAIYAVLAGTDGDDSYLEIYSQDDQELACGKNDYETTHWSDRDTVRSDLG